MLLSSGRTGFLCFTSSEKFTKAFLCFKLVLHKTWCLSGPEGAAHTQPRTEECWMFGRERTGRFGLMASRGGGKSIPSVLASTVPACSRLQGNPCYLCVRKLRLPLTDNVNRGQVCWPEASCAFAANLQCQESPLRSACHIPCFPHHWAEILQLYLFQIPVARVHSSTMTLCHWKGSCVCLCLWQRLVPF